jgi:hypothetical protein
VRVRNLASRARVVKAFFSHDVVGWPKRNERGFMMNHTDGWMGGGMWIWTVIGVLVVVLLAVVINKLSKK